MGLFDADANVALLSGCESVGSWTSENPDYPVADTSNVRDGNASIKSVGSLGTPTFQNLGNLDSYANTFTTAARLQLWYYIDDASKLSGTFYIYASSHASDITQDVYWWSVTTSDLSDGWNLISKKFSEADGQSGSPNVNNIVSFRLNSAKSSSATENIDKIRIFEEAGNMWARAENSSPTEKQWGEVRTLYWYINFTIGKPKL